VRKLPNVRYYLHYGPKVASYIQVLTKGYPKGSVRMVVPHIHSCTICRCTYSGPPVYVCTKNKSVRMVKKSKISKMPLLTVLSDPKPKLTL
jgi:hypothetical protein